MYMASPRLSLYVNRKHNYYLNKLFITFSNILSQSSDYMYRFKCAKRFCQFCQLLLEICLFSLFPSCLQIPLFDVAVTFYWIFLAIEVNCFLIDSVLCPKSYMFKSIFYFIPFRSYIVRWIYIKRRCFFKFINVYIDYLCNSRLKITIEKAQKGKFPIMNRYADRRSFWRFDAIISLTGWSKRGPSNVFLREHFLKINFALSQFNYTKY